MMSKQITRRSFNRRSTVALGIAASTATTGAASVLGANARIRLGFLGVANRGGQLMDAFLEHEDAQIVALCDVDQRAFATSRPKVPGNVDLQHDFRRLLDRDDIDAIVIATPDHWHAVQTVMSCDAGKDVYVEKPLSVTIHEGRCMVQAARRNKCVVQVGTHRRSSPLYSELAKRVQADRYGKICISRAYRLSNMYPDGIGKKKPQAPPDQLDWDMWLGPRPWQPYQETIAPYRFRWWQLFSSQMANWGVHYLDAIRWCTGELAPRSISALGGRFAVDDDRTIPDTMEVTFQFDSGRLAVFGQYETSSNPIFPSGEIEMRGTQGTVYANAGSFQVIPERGGQFQDRAPRMEPEEVSAPGTNKNLTALHARNFLDCIRTRTKPNADIEIGHRSTTFSLLANISLSVGERLEWDATEERFINSDQANELLHYEYRKPWKLG
jgi:predicted dehydrogenase